MNNFQLNGLNARLLLAALNETREDETAERSSLLRELPLPVLRYLGTSTFHHDHHDHVEHNFGFYTSI
ncbi:hypothetical protein A4D02_05425 [Niastella koreensis]|uniref:Uncharacterized protein n=2 Tax=Niastella koreensis TaxID=354356 RepID=G8TCC4_NIAKG|nr:hypothetical protein [Niastella koreensis]AEW01431.1 hypothetical protein Niako_5194 [Niastella koreensis GR20-10]OQP48161.1 hypothetical protein A4D02_05425 [Niastella koreensis]